MGQNSKIEWCDHSVNLWWGCTEVSPCCDNCYARKWAERWDYDIWGNDKPRMIIESAFSDLKKYQDKAAKENIKYRIFLGSMMDLFERPFNLIDRKGAGVFLNDDDIAIEYGNLLPQQSTGDLRDLLFNNISLGKYPNLIFLFLTKRPSNINKYIPKKWKDTPPENVMFGTSFGIQSDYKNVSQLMRVAGKKFLSCEPMISALDITNKGIKNGYSIPTRFTDKGIGIEWTDPGDNYIGVDWVICGGESGSGKRRFNIDAARNLRDQCLKNNIPFFMKQIDKVIPIPDDLMIRQFPDFFNQALL